MGTLTGFSNRKKLKVVENGGGTKDNYQVLWDIFYNAAVAEDDSITQFLYTPSTRYRETYDRVYTLTVTYAGLCTAKWMSESDGSKSDPVTLWDHALVSDHGGGQIIALKHQTGALATHNGKLLAATSKFQTGIYSKRSTNAEDISAWGSSVDVSITSGAAYPYLVETTSGVVFCFYGGQVGATTERYKAFRVYNMAADSWSAEQVFVTHGTSYRAWYCKPIKDPVDGNTVHWGIGDCLVSTNHYQDVYYAKQILSYPSSATSTSAGKLMDTAGLFQTHAVAADWWVINKTDNTLSRVASVDSETQLTLDTDIMASGETYILLHITAAAGTLKHLPMDFSVAAHTPDEVRKTVVTGDIIESFWDITTDLSGNPHLLYLRALADEEGSSADVLRCDYSAGWNITDTGIDSFLVEDDWGAGAVYKEYDPTIIFASVKDGANKGQIQAYQYIASSSVHLDTFEWGSDGAHLHVSGGNIVWTSNDYARISTDHPAFGTRCAKLLGHASTPGSASFALTPGTNYAMRISVYKENNEAYCYPFLHGNGTDAIAVRVDSAENILYRRADGTWVDTTANIVYDAWNVLEVRNINWVAGTYDLYLGNNIIGTSLAMYDTASYNGIWQIMSDAPVAGQDWYAENIQVKGIYYLADGNNGTTAICGDGKITQASPGHNWRPCAVVDSYNPLWPAPKYYTLTWFYIEGDVDLTMPEITMRLAYPGYSAGIYIGCKKDVRSDFGDLRFTTSDGVTKLGSDGKPWIEEKTDYWRCRCRIGKFSVPASAGTYAMYIYHGKADETNANGQTEMNVQFHHCDHFIGSAGALDTDKWTTKAGAISKDGSSSAAIVGDATTRGLVQGNVANFAALPIGVEMQCLIKSGVATPTANQLGMCEDSDLNDRAAVLLHAYLSASDQMTAMTVDATATSTTNIATMALTAWHLWKMLWVMNGANRETRFYRDRGQTNRDFGAVLATHNSATKNVPSESQVPYLYEGTDAGDTTLVDYCWQSPVTDPVPKQDVYNQGEEILGGLALWGNF